MQGEIRRVDPKAQADGASKTQPVLMSGLEFFMPAVNTASHAAGSYIYLSFRISTKRRGQRDNGNKRACVRRTKSSVTELEMLRLLKCWCAAGPVVFYRSEERVWVV